MSTLCSEEDRGINNLILTSVMLSLTPTRSKLHELTSLSLLGVQAPRLNIKIKDSTDQAIIKLMKSEVVKIKKVSHSYTNMDIVIQSQVDNDTIDSLAEPKISKRTITLKGTTAVILSDLGRAAMKGLTKTYIIFIKSNYLTVLI